MPESDNARSRSPSNANQPPPPQPSPRPAPQDEEPDIDLDLNHPSDLLLTNDPIHQTRTQIFGHETQFHPVFLALRGPYSSNTIQDAVLTMNLMTILHNNGQYYIFRTFTPNMLISRQILTAYFQFFFHNIILNVDLTRPTTERTQIRLIHAGLRYPVWRGITNLRRGLRALARWLAIVEVANRPPNSHPNSTLITRLTANILAACAANRNRILSPHYPN